jgi:hypothetical protein
MTPFWPLGASLPGDPPQPCPELLTEAEASPTTDRTAGTRQNLIDAIGRETEP